MTSYSVYRTWTARLEDGTPLPWSDLDLLADQTAEAAFAVAVAGRIPNRGDRICIEIWKNTKAHGNRRDRTVYAERGIDHLVRTYR